MPSPTRRSTWTVAPPTAPSGPATVPLIVAPPGPRTTVVVVLLLGTPDSFTPLRSTIVVVVTSGRSGSGLISWVFSLPEQAAAARTASVSTRTRRRRIGRTAYERASTAAVAS